jgi:hypothetical protein
MRLGLSVVYSSGSLERMFMDRNWMDEFIRSAVAQQIKRHEQANLAALGAAQIPKMFKRLCTQIQADVSTYQTKIPGASLQFEARSDSFMVRHEKFPFFDMTVFAENQRMRIVTVKKKYSDSADGQTETSLFVTATGEGQAYYRIEGNDRVFANEPEISEALLRPLLEFVNS